MGGSDIYTDIIDTFVGWPEIVKWLPWRMWPSLRAAWDLPPDAPRLGAPPVCPPRNRYLVMKRQLTITLDDALLSEAKRSARSRGLSLSSLIEGSLRETLSNDAPSFATRWRGRFRPAQRNDPRDEALARKYLS